MVNVSHVVQRLSKIRRDTAGRTLLLGALVTLFIALSFAQSSSTTPSDQISVEGTVSNESGQPVGGATVQLENKDRSIPAEMQTKADGTFLLTVGRAGAYTLRTQKKGFQTSVDDSLKLSIGERKRVNLTLKPLTANASGTKRSETGRVVP